MDGVIYLSDDRIEGAAEALARLQMLGIPYYFITNNSRHSPEELAFKLQRMGIDAGPDQVVSGVTASVDCVRDLIAPPASVLVMGSTPLLHNLEQAGYAIADWVGGFVPDVVVVGVDFGLTYQRLARATRAIWPGGARFVAVNADGVYPTPDGPLPGAGAIAKAIAHVTGVEPVIVGKPAPRMFLSVIQRAGCTPADLVVVGDLLEVDIAGANAFGATSVFVLTGSGRSDQLDQAPKEHVPAYVIDTLFDLPLDKLLAPAVVTAR